MSASDMPPADTNGLPDGNTGLLGAATAITVGAGNTAAAGLQRIGARRVEDIELLAGAIPDLREYGNAVLQGFAMMMPTIRMADPQLAMVASALMEELREALDIKNPFDLALKIFALIGSLSSLFGVIYGLIKGFGALKGKKLEGFVSRSTTSIERLAGTQHYEIKIIEGGEREKIADVFDENEAGAVTDALRAMMKAQEKFARKLGATRANPKFIEDFKESSELIKVLGTMWFEMEDSEEKDTVFTRFKGKTTSDFNGKNEAAMMKCLPRFHSYIAVMLENPAMTHDSKSNKMEHVLRVMKLYWEQTLLAHKAMVEDNLEVHTDPNDGDSRSFVYYRKPENADDQGGRIYLEFEGVLQRLYIMDYMYAWSGLADPNNFFIEKLEVHDGCEIDPAHFTVSYTDEQAWLQKFYPEAEGDNADKNYVRGTGPQNWHSKHIERGGTHDATFDMDDTSTGNLGAMMTGGNGDDK